MRVIFISRCKRSPSNPAGDCTRGGIKSRVGKGLMPRVQQSLTSLARRVIPGLSSISRANAGIIFTRTPSDEMINGSRNFSFRLVCTDLHLCGSHLLAKRHSVKRDLCQDTAGGMKSLNPRDILFSDVRRVKFFQLLSADTHFYRPLAT